MSLFNFRRTKRVFLDYASITPVDSEVTLTMKPFEADVFANPSALYSEALKAKEAVRNARQKVADILNTTKDSIVFTASGTESNNLALLGVFEALGSRASKLDFVPHFITTTVEHPAILEVCKEIQRRGGEVTLVPVGEDGRVFPKDILSAIKENTVLVSVMFANNEIGTIQPIREISRMIKEYRAKNTSALPYFHVDACQASLYLELDVIKLGVDMLTLDGIKMHGPRGIGMLYVKSGIELHPVNFGGGQEKGLRSGTENVPAIVGFAKALEIAEKLREKESERLVSIRDYGIEQILKKFPNATLNGSQENRLPNNINICFPGIDAEFTVISLDVAGVACSYSSSCRTLKEDSSSYVVEALGKKECSSSSLRFTLGRGSTKEDVDVLLSILGKIVK